MLFIENRKDSQTKKMKQIINKNLPPIYLSTSKKKKKRKIIEAQLNLKWFSISKNLSSVGPKENSKTVAKEEVVKLIDASQTTAPRNYKSIGPKLNTVQYSSLSKQTKNKYFQSRSIKRLKQKKTINLNGFGKSEMNSTFKDISIDERNQKENVIFLEEKLLKELAKTEKDIHSFQKGCENLIESCENTIIRKYKKIACEISK